MYTFYRVDCSLLVHDRQQYKINMIINMFEMQYDHPTQFMFSQRLKKYMIPVPAGLAHFFGLRPDLGRIWYFIGRPCRLLSRDNFFYSQNSWALCFLTKYWSETTRVM